MTDDIRDCIAIGMHAQAFCCKGAIAIGDNVVATIENPHVIGTHLFGEPIPEEVISAFRANPQLSLWITVACCKFLQVFIPDEPKVQP